MYDKCGDAADRVLDAYYAKRLIRGKFAEGKDDYGWVNMSILAAADPRMREQDECCSAEIMPCWFSDFTKWWEDSVSTICWVLLIERYADTLRGLCHLDERKERDIYVAWSRIVEYEAAIIYEGLHGEKPLESHITTPFFGGKIEHIINRCRMLESYAPEVWRSLGGHFATESYDGAAVWRASLADRLTDAMLSEVHDQCWPVTPSGQPPASPAPPLSPPGPGS